MTIRVDTMRRIDHLAGIPLCALLTPWVKLGDRLRALTGRKPGRPEKLLFIELSEMGSAILVDPAMREARARGAALYFLIFKSNQASLSLLNTVPPEQVLTIDASSFFALCATTLSALIKIRRIGIDSVIDLELFSRFTALLTGLSGARRRAGYHRFHGEGLWRGDMLTHKVQYNPHIHITKNFFSLVHAVFAERDEAPFSKVVIGDERLTVAQAQVSAAQLDAVARIIDDTARAARIDFAGARTPGSRIILVNPNASDLLPQRRWAPASFSQLISTCSQRWPDALILITGAPDEHAYAERIRLQADAARALNFAGKVKFGELPALYHLADLMVTNDSGPSHFSSVTPLPTVVLFGPETPALYGSLGKSTALFAGLACSPCVSAANHRKTPCRDNRCMQAIQVDQVVQAMAMHLVKPLPTHLFERLAPS
jgi:ADP-heptose:LPS heptosyltransferase